MLKEGTIFPTYSSFKSVGPGLLTKDGKKLIACLDVAGEYCVPNGVTVIGHGAFQAK